ncbi:hypothetical protein [Rhizobium phaseoli]|uniref:hypothetical protein n=1 Tax=Rhizobium phaseoli TaxID=396 RepID=UPI002556C29B|nr:hypothetical protein [Rhizobium phaseoli]MDK4725655.1 hypothetical protein [Rhizobium phaseoli]
MTVMTVSPKQYIEPVMVPGMGAQPMPAPKYVPANDNVPVAGVIGLTGGQYIGLTRHNPNSASITGLQRRHGDFMQTATGRKFWPMDPRAEEVFIEDIAHSLSLQCRYAGHCLRFYSVAEHSVLMARHLRWEGVEVALWAMLHDASEAYLVDVPRPVKPYLDGYKAAEAKVMAAVCDRFGLPHEMPAVVHDADNRIIADELVNLVPMDWHARYAGEELGVELRFWSPEKAEEEFMATFEALMDGRARGMAA